jgi:CO/xanthine dehydrogenase Mo-binding subunit
LRSEIFSVERLKAVAPLQIAKLAAKQFPLPRARHETRDDHIRRGTVCIAFVKIGGEDQEG